MYSQQIDILTDAMDELAVALYVPEAFYKGIAQEVINNLGDYPRTKGNCKPYELGAYLHVSNARNILKLAEIEYYEHDKAFELAQNAFEIALGLLIDHNE